MRTSTSGTPTLALLLGALGVAVPAAAQQHDHADHPAAAPVPIYAQLGEFQRPISSSDARTRALFDQGMRLTYGFGHAEAVRSFRAAREHDPQCAMCWWGEAWALGPYINAPRMGPQAERDAHHAISQAAALRDAASDVERALIDAMVVRYQPTPDAERRPALDSAYADAMRTVVRRFPHDLDAATLFAEALMVLRPWDQWERDGTPKPGTEEVLEVLERVLERDLTHPGACHLYIHAVEASARPERAEACADRLGEVIPGASHLRHMPSHIYMRVGRYGDAVRANQQARHVDLQAEHGGPPGVYPTHNLHMLAFAASYDGQSAVALQAARDLARLSQPAQTYVHQTLVRFGRWEEILELDEAPEPTFARGSWHFARGLARLRGGEAGAAQAELDALRGLRAESGDRRFRRHPEADLLGIAEGILAGEILAAAGEIDAAAQALRHAAELEDGLAYDEPEPWFIPARHVLGAVLLEAGRAADAEHAFRAHLDTHPENGWALHGLAEALRRQDREDEAGEIEERRRRAWQRADVWPPGARY